MTTNTYPPTAGPTGPSTIVDYLDAAALWRSLGDDEAKDGNEERAADCYGMASYCQEKAEELKKS